MLNLDTVAALQKLARLGNEVEARVHDENQPGPTERDPEMLIQWIAAMHVMIMRLTDEIIDLRARLEGPE